MSKTIQLQVAQTSSGFILYRLKDDGSVHYTTSSSGLPATEWTKMEPFPEEEKKPTTKINFTRREI
jgi:hypothetical protein